MSGLAWTIESARNAIAQWPNDVRAAMGVELRSAVQSEITWPTAKGDPIYPVWSYKDRNRLYESSALRLMAHDLVDRIKQLELPVREAMKQARGDGLDPLAYSKMMRDRVNGLEREVARLQREHAADVERMDRAAETIEKLNAEANGRVGWTRCGWFGEGRGQCVFAEGHRGHHTCAEDGRKFDELTRERQTLREDVRRFENSHAVLMAERESLQNELAQLKAEIASIEPDGYILYTRSAAGGPEPEEQINYLFASRSEPHEGEGWVPLYSRPPQEPTTGPLKLDTDSQVFFYEQDHYYLSNFSAFMIEIDGKVYPTSEHAYHCYKFPNDPLKQAAIRTAVSAHVAFKIAERWKQYRIPDWDNVKLDVMRRILRAKAEQHEYVRRKLLQTGDRELIENSWRDPYWGWGENRDGLNILGKLWMEVRAELRAAADAPVELCDMTQCCQPRGHAGEHDELIF